MDAHYRLPSIDGLRAFEATARLGSFERAAEVLHVTASAVSKRVATVEALLGTTLFTRSASTLALTPAGTEYLAQVSAALALLSALPLHQRANQGKERLRVKAPPTFARQVLVPHLDDFSGQHPGIDLEVVLSIPCFDAPGVQGGVEIRHGDAAAVGGTVLMRDRVLPMASPHLLARLPPLRVPADLAGAPLLRTPLEPWTPWFQAAGLPWPEPGDGPRLVDLGLTLEAAINGQGVALARPSLARQALRNGTLQPLFGLTAEPASQYHLMPHNAQGAAALLARWLRAVCEAVAEQSLREALARVSGPA
jgi:LysR family glycine cleavage system transcriptional activator